MNAHPGSGAERPPISVVVIAQDEERNIGRCLSSVADLADEMIVVDSGSSDRTVALARDMGATVVHHDWAGYGPQKQFAVSQARNRWILSLDADEVVPVDLTREIAALDYTCDAYEVPRAVWYLGRWIRHGVWYPGYVVRLFRSDRAAFTADLVHEQVEVNGKTCRLRHDLLHYSYRDVSHHLEKMDEFAELAAKRMKEKGRRGGLFQLVVRPPFEFFRCYVLRGGFLDGRPGLVIAALHAQSNFLKYARLVGLQWAERRHAGSEEPTPR